LIGDCETAALVARDGSIDWLCLPRFDSPACFAALLGDPGHGRWRISPDGEAQRVERAYREGTLVLDTTFHTESGTATVTDCMIRRDRAPLLVRVVRGLRGTVRMTTELIVRFDYGSIIPWVRKKGDCLLAIAGPDSLRIRSDIPLRGRNFTTVGDFDVSEGQRVAFSLVWHPSHVDPPPDPDPHEVIACTEREWRAWSSRCTHQGEWRAPVVRSLITLKALTHTSTGGIIAAPTTSLPEFIGGVRNWDYRFCWVRDATFTLLALLDNGYIEEASAWREWLLRAAAGEPAQLQILYGLDGRRRIREEEVPWLPGYEGSRPVRIGNAAFEQRQLDVYGELMDAMHQRDGEPEAIDSHGWTLQQALLEFLETCWDQPDEGIWEVRGPRRQFTHSKVMAWVAFDRGVRRLEALTSGREPLLERWRAVADRIHGEVCRLGFDTQIGSFVQYYGAKTLDASLLMIPLVGFLPADDSRVQGTVRAIEATLIENGLVRRYENIHELDGLPAGEGAFLPCSFWLVDNYALMGRYGDARQLFTRLLSLSNDVGLLAEEYDPQLQRMLGNFPQAFSHISLVNSAHNLSFAQPGPAHRRKNP
jgi:GH15 family glucan-1,4-alpha-glucosidase